MLLSLPSHVDDFKANGNYGNIELMAMGASQFSLTQDIFDKDFVAAMYARVGIPGMGGTARELTFTGPYELLDSHHANTRSTGHHHRSNAGPLQSLL